MEDARIIQLYWERSEDAISETRSKYGRYCHSIAYNILYSDEDAAECVNDTYSRMWSSIPPQKPAKLSSFIGKITRNIALDRYDAQRAQKRCGGVELALEEIAECVPDSSGEANVSDEYALKEAINAFLRGLPQRTRIIFMRRYWYFCSIEEIARDLEMSESNVKVTLMRTREKFKAHLTGRGISI